MIESLVNAFSKNSFLFSKKPDSPGGDFQQTLSKYGQGVEQNKHRQSSNESFEYKNEYRQDDSHEYSRNHTEEYREPQDEPTDYETEQYDEAKEEDASSETKKYDENSGDDNTEELDKIENNEEDTSQILALLSEMGISKEDLAGLKQAFKSEDSTLIKEELSKLVDKVKSFASSKVLSPDMQKQLSRAVEILEQLAKSNDNNLLSKLKSFIQVNPKTIQSHETPGKELSGDGLVNRTDKDIQQNNAKHAEMKEASQGNKNIKFRADVDVKFTQEVQKHNQAIQNKAVVLEAGAKSNSGQNSNSQSNSQGDEFTGKSPDFLKKMKNILKVNNPSSQGNELATDQNSKLQTSTLRPSFMNRATTGRFMQQLVSQLQNMVKSNTTLSASVDFKTAEFGDMKLAAEAQGTNLAVKLSNIASSMRLDIMSLKSELDAELKSLGFENVDLDFGAGYESSQKHAFEEEMNKRLGKDQVKLPGDHIADLNAIDEWMKNFEKVM